MLSWFSIWMSWYIVMLPAAVYSEIEIIKDGNMTLWIKQTFDLAGRGLVWLKNGKTCGIGEYADFWFITHRVNLETTFAEVIYVDIEAELNTQCYNEAVRSYFPCYSNKFEVYAYHGKDHISVGNILDIFSQSLYNITNNTNLARANLTMRSTQTTFFIPQNNSEGVTFAVRSRGACGKIFRIKMYYHVCKEKVIKTIKFERTSSPAKGFKNVTANCSENSIPSQNAASFKGYCYPNGSWRIPLDDNMECLCVEGYTLNKRDGSCSSCSNTSYKTGISNDNCTECPMNTVSSDVKRASCVCKDGYHKTSSDKSEVSPCYALPEIREKLRIRLIAYGVELSWTAPKNSLKEIILYNITCFICSQSICNIPCQNETYDPSSNNLRQTLVTVSNLIAGGNYVFRVYVSVKDVVPEGEWRYIETGRVQVTSDSVKETTDDSTDDSGIIINYIIIATTVAGVFLSIIIVLLVKYKRLKRALRLLTHVDIPLKAVDTPQESLPVDQEGPGYETVSTVVREFHDDVDTNANNSEDTSAEGHYEEVGVPSVGVHKKLGYKTPGQIEAYEEPKISQENPGYTELDKNRLQGRNAADDSTYQKLQRQDSDVSPVHERRESNEDIKMGRNLPGYEELDQSKREADDYTPLTISGQQSELA